MVPYSEYGSAGAEWLHPAFSVGGWYEAGDTAAHVRFDVSWEQQHWSEKFTRVEELSSWTTITRTGIVDMRLQMIRFAASHVIPIGSNFKFSMGMDLGFLLSADGHVKGDDLHGAWSPSPSSPGGSYVTPFEASGSYKSQLNPLSIGLRLGFSYRVLHDWDVGLAVLLTALPINPYHEDKRPQYLYFTIGRRLFTFHRGAIAGH